MLRVASDHDIVGVIVRGLFKDGRDAANRVGISPYTLFISVIRLLSYGKS